MFNCLQVFTPCFLFTTLPRYTWNIDEILRSKPTTDNLDKYIVFISLIHGEVRSNEAENVPKDYVNDDQTILMWAIPGLFNDFYDFIIPFVCTFFMNTY